MRYNPPPNWPSPPDGWSPPPGWAPDPAWGYAPEGWQLWSLEKGDAALIGRGHVYGGPVLAAVKIGVHVSPIGLHVGKKRPDKILVEWPAVEQMQLGGVESSLSHMRGAMVHHRFGGGNAASLMAARTTSSAQTSVYLRAYGREITLVIEQSPAYVRYALGPWLIQIEHRLEHQARASHAAPQIALPPPPNPVLQLEGLARLRASGAIEPGEYEAKKQEIMRRI